jgi:putative methanogenesis marker protein 8
MMMAALRAGLLDAAVTVCDGAGTVATSDPQTVQGVGARMNGLFHTSPIPEVLAGLRSRGAVVHDDARIDQIRGIEQAAAHGWRRLAVTVNIRYGESFAALRQLEARLGLTLTILGICSTGASEERAADAAGAADLTWSCASKAMRDLGSRARLQLTHGIPVFVYTARGVEFLAAYGDAAAGQRLRALDPAKQYLLSSGPGQDRVRLGETSLSVHEAALPVASKRCPCPLD